MLRILDVCKLNYKYFPAFGFIIVLLAIAVNMAMAMQDKYTVTVPGGLAFSEFKGYEDWQSVSVSKTEHAFAIILANPVMIEAYRSGIPGNGKPFPDGSKIAKIHYNPAKSADAPNPTTEVPGTLLNVDFIEKDSKRFPTADGGGWGYAAFNYNAASDTFTPATENDKPPQANDAKCGVACHTIAQSKDYIFTEYPKR
jgi:Cytochrome P460